MTVFTSKDSRLPDPCKEKAMDNTSFPHVASKSIEPPSLLQIPRPQATPGFLRQLFGRHTDHPLIRGQITAAYGFGTLMLAVIAGIMLAVYTWQYSIYNNDSITIIITTVIFIVCYCINFRRTLLRAVGHNGFIDLAVITLASTTLCMAYIRINYASLLPLALPLVFADLLLTFMLRLTKLDVKIHPVFLYGILLVIDGGAFSLYCSHYVYRQFDPLPAVYAMFIYTCIDCGLHVAARSKDNWQSEENELGYSSVCGLISRLFLGILYFPYPIAMRLGINVY